jgi:hypothetical protein
MRHVSKQMQTRHETRVLCGMRHVSCKRIWRHETRVNADADKTERVRKRSHFREIPIGRLPDRIEIALNDRRRELEGNLLRTPSEALHHIVGIALAKHACKGVGFS